MGYYVDIEQTARRYVDILTDAGFKAVFGDQRNKDVLIDLLNIILPYDRKVKDISYMTTELPQFSPSRKNVRLDLRCMGEDGTVFIVEVQCYRQSNFFKRCVLYAAKAYDSGSVSGDRQKSSKTTSPSRMRGETHRRRASGCSMISLNMKCS